MNYELFDKVFAKIEKNEAIVKSGGQIGIPYPFKRLNNELAGIQKGEVHIITAGTGVSKSKYTRYTYIYNVYRNYLKTGYKVKILYFPLEDSDDLVMQHLMVYYLFEHHNIRVDMKAIMSKKGYPIDPKIKLFILQGREYFGKLFEILDIYPEASTPEAIFAISCAWAARIGTIKKDEYNQIVAYDLRIDIHTILIVDNLSNITTGIHKDEHSAIGNFTKEKSRKVMSKLFDFTIVLDAQQDMANDKAQYAGDGKLVLAKLMPNVNALANNKESARDAHLAFGLFAPHRYGIKEWPKARDKNDHPGYNIELMGNFFRELKVLKNNEGDTDFKVPLWFDGQIEYFEELPNYKDVRGMEAVYNKAREYRNSIGQQQLF